MEGLGWGYNTARSRLEKWDERGWVRGAVAAMEEIGLGGSWLYLLLGTFASMELELLDIRRAQIAFDCGRVWWFIHGVMIMAGLCSPCFLHVSDYSTFGYDQKCHHLLRCRYLDDWAFSFW